jgi:hypothetical protein
MPTQAKEWFGDSREPPDRVEINRNRDADHGKLAGLVGSKRIDLVRQTEFIRLLLVEEGVNGFVLVDSADRFGEERGD